MIYALGEDQPILEGDGHWVADNATVLGKVTLKDRASVWFGAVLRGDMERITIGERTNVQDLSVLHTDAGFALDVGADVTIGHQVMLHGCQIGDGALIGIGSTILNGAVIGAGSLVGAHALITEGKHFPPHSLIMGTPAKVVRELEPAEVERLKASALHYAHNAARFDATLTPIEPNSARN
ncbi:MAG: gamma carbonic anhydrase family protein [Pseudomonadota bacterium]